MWDVNENIPMIDPQGIGALSDDYEQYYNDHLTQWQNLVKAVKMIFAEHGLAEAVSIAKCQSARGSLYLKLNWRFVYPYAYEDKRHDDYEADAYKNNYFAEFLINSNGSHGSYRSTMAFSVAAPDKSILTGGFEDIDSGDYDEVKLPAWFVTYLEQITKDTVANLKKMKEIKPSLKSKIAKGLSGLIPKVSFKPKK